MGQSRDEVLGRKLSFSGSIGVLDGGAEDMRGVCENKGPLIYRPQIVGPLIRTPTRAPLLS